MLLTVIPVGYLIIISCILIVAIPVLTVKMFSKHSKRVSTENYLEAEILALNHRLHWHKEKISSLENGIFDLVLHQHVPIHDKVVVQNVVTQSEMLINIDENQFERDLKVAEDTDTGTDQAETSFAQSFNSPRMMQLTLADQPDLSFLDSLNLKSNVLLFPIEAIHEARDEEEIPMEQMEFTLDVEALELYKWTKGIHFVHLSIKDHYGEELALCEIQGRAGTTMIQHPKISAMKDGDSFAASILVDRNGIKVVDKLWCDLAEEFSWSAEG